MIAKVSMLPLSVARFLIATVKQAPSNKSHADADHTSMWFAALNHRGETRAKQGQRIKKRDGHMCPSLFILAPTAF